MFNVILKINLANSFMLNLLSYLKRLYPTKIKIINSLKKVGLNKTYLTRKVASLSGGEQQRVAIARAIYRDSQIIIADEPTGNLDETNAFKILDIFKDMKKLQKTIIIVTHDERIARYFDKIYDLKDGTLVEKIIQPK
jgi:putative ABC transport system ATP-binding protein